MGELAHRTVRRSVAVLVVAAVAIAAVATALIRPDAREQFRSWLREQPGIVSVDEPGAALAVGPGGLLGVRAFEPTERAVVSGPLDVDVVGRLGAAVVGYAASHPSLGSPTVELRQGPDVVMVGARPDVNATTSSMLRAMRGLVGVVGVQATVRSGAAPFTATVRPGSNLPALATTLAATLAGALPDRGSSWVDGPVGAAVRDPAGHEVRVVAGGTVSPSAAAAFTLAVDTDPSALVSLTADGGGGPDRRSVIRLAGSTSVGQTAAALHRAGFGLSRHGEVVEGPDGPIAMDQAAWARAAAAALARRAGARAAVIDVGRAEDDRPVTADLRIRPEVSFEQLLAALPGSVEQVAAHTAAAAPDYERDDALAPDPQVECPPGQGGLNLAYDGPAAALPGAAGYLAALRAVAVGASCVHWAERGRRGRPAGQTLLVRLPLLEDSWRPVLDVVRSRRADLGSAHPDVVLLLPVPGGHVTGVFTLSEGEAPYVTALHADTQDRARQAQEALQPLVRYWTRG